MWATLAEEGDIMMWNTIVQFLPTFDNFAAGVLVIVALGIVAACFAGLLRALRWLKNNFFATPMQALFSVIVAIVVPTAIFLVIVGIGKVGQYANANAETVLQKLNIRFNK